jgi:hypothetical protein
MKKLLTLCLLFYSYLALTVGIVYPPPSTFILSPDFWNATNGLQAAHALGFATNSMVGTNATVTVTNYVNIFYPTTNYNSLSLYQVYADAVNGNDSYDGTIERPTATLSAAELIATNRYLYRGLPATVVAVNGNFIESTYLGNYGINSWYFADGVTVSNASASSMFTLLSKTNLTVLGRGTFYPSSTGLWNVRTSPATVYFEGKSIFCQTIMDSVTGQATPKTNYVDVNLTEDLFGRFSTSYITANAGSNSYANIKIKARNIASTSGVLLSGPVNLSGIATMTNLTYSFTPSGTLNWASGGTGGHVTIYQYGGTLTGVSESYSNKAQVFLYNVKAYSPIMFNANFYTNWHGDYTVESTVSGGPVMKVFSSDSSFYGTNGAPVSSTALWWVPFSFNGTNGFIPFMK